MRSRARFPDHAVLGEEGHDPEGTHDFEWIVDPIDGTINFVNRLPFFAVSIGVLYRRRPVVGVLRFPLSGETLHARRGGGAFREVCRSCPPGDRAIGAGDDRLATRLSFPVQDRGARPGASWASRARSAQSFTRWG